MKSKQLCQALSLFGTLCLLVSCASVSIPITYHSADTDNIPPAYSGNIKSYKKSETYKTNDIVLKGEKAGRWGIDILYPYQADLMKWTGTVSYNDISYPIQINYNDHTEIHLIRAIHIMNLPSVYKFKKFNISDNSSIWEKNVRESDLPVKLTSFLIGGKEFSLLLTSMSVFPTMKEGLSSFYHMVILDEQRFHIADQSGTVYAEFTKDRYQIFDVPSETDPELFQLCIAAFSIVRNICVAQSIDYDAASESGIVF